MTSDLATFLDSLDGPVVVGHALIVLGFVLWAVCAVAQMVVLHGRSRR